ncbi:MAG: DNA modification methylase [Alphaproteobacteria bacterium]|nr:MAG: DNA modification methylase [Alphaproteobacteria bacterium]
MFPLEFPLGILQKHARAGARVLDPFCGRGTTNFAARLLALRTVGIDASPVAIAATRAKLVAPTPGEIIDEVKKILQQRHNSIEIPEGEFWKLAYHIDVLRDICLIRDALLNGLVSSRVAAALRGIMLGALHGPMGRTKHSYFSNQCPRTYGPKPAYAVKFWTKRGLLPPRVDVLAVIAERARRYYGNTSPEIVGAAIEGDSRQRSTLEEAREVIGKFDWIITSPPYYGLRTYLPDQWIRNWFLGGPASVDYSSRGQISHSGRDRFVDELRKVWANAGAHCKPGATLVIRFGSIGDRLVEDPAQLVSDSLEGTAWVRSDVRDAANAARGKRQADTFHRRRSAPLDEVDVWAKWQP